MSKVKNPSTSDVKQGHKRKGGGSKPHSSRGRIGTATIKKNVDAAARRANERSAAAVIGKNKPVPRPKKKPAPPKVPTIKAKGEMKRRPTMEEQLKAAGVGIDYTQMNVGGLIGGQKKLDANKDGKISGADFEMMGANRKKYGGKISYKMAGGQVVDSSYD
jgi:hypothetical protein